MKNNSECGKRDELWSALETSGRRGGHALSRTDTLAVCGGACGGEMTIRKRNFAAIYGGAQQWAILEKDRLIITPLESV